MDPRLIPWLAEGQKILGAGGVREIEFAGPTYQVEVVDTLSGETFWPLLHFDSKLGLKDAMCGCDSVEEGCPHLSAAYLKIVQTPDQLPLHRHFPSHFFKVLFQQIADHLSYQEKSLQEVEEGYFRASEPIIFEVKGTIEETKRTLERLIKERAVQTPENSIQFSELPADELAWWREGRPSATLRFALSVFSDLAKWCYILQLEKPFSVTTTDDQEGLPTHFCMEGHGLTIRCHLEKEDLIALIPTFDTIETQLKVHKELSGKLSSISYDECENKLRIQHIKEEKVDHQPHSRIDGWQYIQEKGFFALEGKSFFDRDEIAGDEIGEALSEHTETVAQFLSVETTSHPINYHLFFDNNWQLHIQAYLFQLGDLEGGRLFKGEWAYVPRRGFIKIEQAYTDRVHQVISCENVSSYVNTHKIWLSSQSGFEPHLASVESQISYRVTDQLLFEARHKGIEEGGAKDFGDWIYYPEQGFFAKSHTKTGSLIRPGLTVPKTSVSSFIKLNRDDLEMVKHFFAPTLPIKERGVRLLINEDNEVVVKPSFERLSSFEESEITFFGDFVYLAQLGFHELPLQMRLPEGYQEEKVVPRSMVHSFLTHDLGKLEPHILEKDPRLRIPCQADVHLRYLVRTKEGVKCELVIMTEFGEVNLRELISASQMKESILFTEGGLIDLREERFLWLKSIKRELEEGVSTIGMSTLDFLRLDASIGFLAPPSDNPQHEVTLRLLKELREFLVADQPNLKGLTSKLRLYQQTGLHWLWFLYKNGLSGLLCDDMGLGKTHQAMALMAAIENVENGRFLVVCPTSVIYHWQDKLERFLPGLNVHTFHGMRRKLPTLSKGGVVLTSYGIVRLQKESLKKMAFDLAVYDEVQVAKNPSSQVHTALRAMNAKMRLGLTGTPIENNLRELKALFDLTLPGYMPTEARFRDHFVVPIERDLDEERKAELTTMIKPFVLRRRKKEVLDELPEKSEESSYFDLSKEQIELYKGLLGQDRDALVSQLRDREGNVPYMHVFSLLSKLKQICNHPALYYKEPARYEDYESGKWELFVELMEEARRSDQKVVVFSQYLQMLDIMELYVRSQGWGYAQIRGDTVDRKAELKRFQEEPDCCVFLGSLQAAGLGIDLTAASVVIMYDRWWNAARENQAIDRVHRMGQKWSVQVFKLIAKGTIEEKIDRMIFKKGQLMEEVVTADDQSVIKKFSRSDLIDLLSFDADES